MFLENHNFFKILLASYLVIHDVECVGCCSGLRLHIYAVILINSTFAENYSVEWAVEADLNLHMSFAAHDLKTGNVCHVQRSLNIPKVNIILSTSDGDKNGEQSNREHLELKEEI